VIPVRPPGDHRSGVTSVSATCSGAPQWEQRISALVGWPHELCRIKAGGPASEVVHASPQALTASSHPAWFHNLRANPDVIVELGDSSFRARAVVTAGDERDPLYRMVAGTGSPYEKNTTRVFPVIVLEGVPAPG
jgi:hypothetical protein